MYRIVSRLRRPVAVFAPVEMVDNVAAHADRLVFRFSEIVGKTGDLGVHFGAPELFFGRLLSSCHFDERRAAEKDLGLILHHHRVVTHGREVGATSGGAAKDQRDRGDAGFGEPCEISEPLPSDQKNVGLVGEIGATRLDEVDQRQTILHRDVHDPE